MAKKKRKAPSTPCPKCGKRIHPRSKTCKYCGGTVPSKKKTVARKKKQTTTRTGIVHQLRIEQKKLAARMAAIETLLDAYRRR